MLRFGDLANEIDSFLSVETFSTLGLPKEGKLKPKNLTSPIGCGDVAGLSLLLGGPELPDFPSLLCPLSKASKISFKHSIYIRTLSKLLASIYVVVHFNPSWLVWSRNQMNCACCSAQTAHKLVQTGSAK